MGQVEPMGWTKTETNLQGKQKERDIASQQDKILQSKKQTCKLRQSKNIKKQKKKKKKKKPKEN